MRLVEERPAPVVYSIPPKETLEDEATPEHASDDVADVTEAPVADGTAIAFDESLDAGPIAQEPAVDDSVAEAVVMNEPVAAESAAEAMVCEGAFEAAIEESRETSPPAGLVDVLQPADVTGAGGDAGHAPVAASMNASITPNPPAPAPGARLERPHGKGSRKRRKDRRRKKNRPGGPGEHRN